MNYPKELMSISDLVQLGYSRDELKRYTRIKGVPAFKTTGGGKWYFRTALLDEWINKLSQK